MKIRNRIKEIRKVRLSDIRPNPRNWRTHPSPQRDAVRGTLWNEFIELNRMALADWLPRNGESRALAVSMRLLKQHYPWIKWVITFADGCQCGDGTIYRAAGFVLTGIKRNTTIIEFPDGRVEASLVLTNNGGPKRKNLARAYGADISASASAKPFFDIGAKIKPGFQLRYIYFLDPACRANLTVPELPYSAISERGAGMYKGQRRAESIGNDAPAVQAGEGGATPTSALQLNSEADNG